MSMYTVIAPEKLKGAVPETIEYTEINALRYKVTSQFGDRMQLRVDENSATVTVLEFMVD